MIVSVGHVLVHSDHELKKKSNMLAIQIDRLLHRRWPKCIMNGGITIVYAVTCVRWAEM